ncbi:MAG: hypothetical protein ACREJ2_09650 [Planctomycetota bacterium]
MDEDEVVGKAKYVGIGIFGAVGFEIETEAKSGVGDFGAGEVAGVGAETFEGGEDAGDGDAST